jgi:hypothetical protein
VRELLGDKPDRVIVDSAFSVGPHTFRYYKFSLPVGSANVAAVGQFKSAAQSPAAAAEVDNSIEAYVLTESAFTEWQKGYATASLYDSGNVAESTVHAEIPAGAGIYYLVFSNKHAPQTAKSIHATVVLRYKSWLHCTLISHNGAPNKLHCTSFADHFHCRPVWLNISDGRSSPAALSRSANLGLIPAELNAPITRPSD